MIFLDKPYVSDLLLETIRKHGLPIVATQAALEFGVEQMPSVITEREAVELALSTPDPLVYVVSESSIGWIAENLGATGVPACIEQFKNKAEFRRRTSELFPGLQHRELSLAELARFDPSEFPTPFILKPSVGFFSLGVKRVTAATDWDDVYAGILGDLERAAGLFPRQVLDTSHFLIESCIAGREYAIDAYYDADGEPVILSILEHLFASENDTSDRVYVTSREIVLENLERFGRLLEDVGRVFSPRNFPVHVELRVDAQGQLWPIEVNPARFGGWCTTSDLTQRAYGVNPYLCLYRQERPDWDSVLRGKEGLVFSIVALGNTTGIEGRDIRTFDYDGVAAHFEHPIELRRTDYREYPIFGFLFTRTRRENLAELDWALNTDLREFASTS